MVALCQEGGQREIFYCPPAESGKAVRGSDDQVTEEHLINKKCDENLGTED